MSRAPLSVDSIYFNADDQRVTIDGGEGGIRTPGTRKRTIDFESTALDHSATSPEQVGSLKIGLQLCTKNFTKTNNAGRALQSVQSLQTPVQESQVLKLCYINTCKKLNQVFTPLVNRI